MTFKSTTQPHCRYCGKPIRKHTRTVWINGGFLPGNDSDSSRHVVVDPPPRTAADCERLTNWQVLSVRRSRGGDTISRFSEWDGESYADEFFCTGTCAQAMGYAACRTHNLATQSWRKATQNQNPTGETE